MSYDNGIASAMRLLIFLAGLTTVVSSPLHLSPRNTTTPTVPKIIMDNDWVANGYLPFLLALNADWDLLGLTSCTANTWALQTSLHALALLEIGNLSDCIPVYKGADYPLLNTPEAFQIWEDIHGVLPFQGVFAAENATAEAEGGEPTSGNPDRIVKEAFVEGYPNVTVAGNNSAAWMVEQVRKYPGEVTIYAAGALTNIALAVRMDDQFARLAKQLVVMGGYVDDNLFKVTGSLYQAAINSDLNLITDPEASKIVLTAPWPKITLVGNGANQVTPDQAYLNSVDMVQTPYSTLMYKYYGLGFPFWDETAIFAVLDPKNVVNSTTFYVDVDTSYASPNYGNIYAYQESLKPKRQTLREVEYVFEIDAMKFEKEVMQSVQYPKSCAELGKS